MKTKKINNLFGLMIPCKRLSITFLQWAVLLISLLIIHPALLSQCTLGVITEDPSCNGSLDGSISIEVTGSTGSLTFTWDPDLGNTANPTGLPAGTYSLNVTDEDQCNKDTIIILEDPPVLNLICQVINHPTAPDATDGLAEIEISGGTPSFTVSLNGPNGDSSFQVDQAATVPLSGLEAGDYSLSLTDANNCTIGCILELIAPDLPCELEVNTINTNPLCNGQSSGSIDLEVISGNEPYGFMWNDGNTSEDRTDLPAGTYAVTVIESNNPDCSTIVENIVLTDPEALVIDCSNVTNPSTTGGMDGIAQLVISGGTPGFTVTLVGPGINNTINLAQAAVAGFPNLSAGAYTATLTDNNDCVANCSFTLSDPAVLCELDISVTSMHPSCNGESSGSIDIEVNSGNEPYDFIWNDGSTMEDRSGLPAGIYAVTVTERENPSCSVSEQNIVLTDPEVLVVTCENINDPNSVGGMDGSVEIVISGGTPSYMLTLSGPNLSTIVPVDQAETVPFTQLAAGSYTVSLTDENGCSANCSFSLNDPVVPCNLEASGATTNPQCNGQSTGSINIQVTNGNAPYSFIWNDGTMQKDRPNLPAGTYTVTISEVNNGACSIIRDFTLEDANALSLQINTEDVSCNGASDGEAMVSALGGTSNYSFTWASGETSSTRSNLSAGNYDLTVSDTNGCIETGTAIINEPAVLVAPIDVINNISCDDLQLGQLSVNPTGGTAPYSTLWNDGQSSEIATFDVAGMYMVTITDANGCLATGNANLTQDAVPEIIDFPLAPISVNNEENTTITYTSTILDVVWSFEIIEEENILFEDPVLANEDGDTYTISLKPVLVDDLKEGMVSIRVTVRQGDCEGEPVVSTIIIRPDIPVVVVSEIFSPNGDGENDVWEIVFPEMADPDNYTVVVYSRNGQKVLEANSMSEPWDGNGCSDGAYYYIIRDRMNDITYKGALSIIR